MMPSCQLVACNLRRCHATVFIISFTVLAGVLTWPGSHFGSNLESLGLLLPGLCSRSVLAHRSTTLPKVPCLCRVVPLLSRLLCLWTVRLRATGANVRGPPFEERRPCHRERRKGSSQFRIAACVCSSHKTAVFSGERDDHLRVYYTSLTFRVLDIISMLSAYLMKVCKLLPPPSSFFIFFNFMVGIVQSVM